MIFSKLIKGYFGELKGTITQNIFLDSKTYKTFNNITLESTNGSTQIDHIIISKYGIFIVEDKNINGFVFGDENSQNWTIVNYKSKYQIQNPLKQNYRHIKIIVELFKINMNSIHSVVVFRGNCKIKTDVPKNVITNDYISYIQSFNCICFTENQVNDMCQTIEYKAQRKSFITNLKHVNSLTERYSSITTCPKCGNKLVIRIAKKGRYMGKEFLGCSNYPKCHFTKNL